MSNWPQFPAPSLAGHRQEAEEGLTEPLWDFRLEKLCGPVASGASSRVCGGQLPSLVMGLTRTLAGKPQGPSLSSAPLCFPASPSSSFFLFFFYKFIYFIYLFLAMLGLRCWARAFSSCGVQGLLSVALHGLLIVVASLVAEHRL